MKSSHEESVLYEETGQAQENVKHYTFDYINEILILVIRDPKLKATNEKLLKIVDCKSGKILLRLNIKNRLNLLNRIKSGLFKLVDGHFYFGNQVYKLRYDLFEQEGQHTFNQDNIYD
jgi:hypothetical protein